MKGPAAYPPGTIIVPNAGYFRYVEFVRALFALYKPNGTRLAFPTSGLVTQNLNKALLQLHGEWAWLQADDHTFQQDILFQLLDLDADVVVPLCVRRSPPHHLVIGKETTVENPDVKRTYPAYDALGLEELPDEPFPVEIAGTGGMLIRRHVFEAIEFPYFESTDGLFLNEDIEFCRKVRRAGFEILCDPRLQMGHIANVPVWPLA